MAESTNHHLLDVDNLVKWFPVTAGVMRRKVADVKAVDGISFFIRAGETLAIPSPSSARSCV